MIKLTPTSETITVEYDVRTSDAVKNQRPNCNAARGTFTPTSAAIVYDRTAETYAVELTGPCVDARWVGFARHTGSVRVRPDIQVVADIVGQVLADFDQEPLP